MKRAHPKPAPTQQPQLITDTTARQIVQSIDRLHEATLTATALLEVLWAEMKPRTKAQVCGISRAAERWRRQKVKAGLSDPVEMATDAEEAPPQLPGLDGAPPP